MPSTAPANGPLLGATRATSLQRIANRAIVCHVLDAMLAADVRDVAVLSPADVADEVYAIVEREGPEQLRILHVPYEPDDGDRDVLLAAAEFVGGQDCVLHRGDGLLGQPLRSLLEPQQPFVDVLALVQDELAPERPLRLVPDEELTDLDSAVARGVFCGVCAMGPGMLRRLAADGRAPVGLDFTGWAADLANTGAIGEVRVASRWRRFSGDTQDLLAMNRAALDELEEEPLDSGLDDNRFEGPIAIDPSATINSSVIIGPAIIGADVVISHSYVGPHTSIGERARIEGVEIERSIVLAGASVLHLSSRLVASVVGRDARIFRDFSMPRALRLQVGDGDEVALC